MRLSDIAKNFLVWLHVSVLTHWAAARTYSIPKNRERERQGQRWESGENGRGKTPAALWQFSWMRPAGSLILGHTTLVGTSTWVVAHAGVFLQRGIRVILQGIAAAIVVYCGYLNRSLLAWLWLAPPPVSINGFIMVPEDIDDCGAFGLASS